MIKEDLEPFQVGTVTSGVGVRSNYIHMDNSIRPFGYDSPLTNQDSSEVTVRLLQFTHTCIYDYIYNYIYIYICNIYIYVIYIYIVI